MSQGTGQRVSPLFDTHAHLDDEQFDDIRAEVIGNAVSAGVRNIVCVGTTACSSEKCLRIAEQFPIVHAAVGIQPNYCADAKADDWDRVIKLADSDRAVAIGETGLDRYWDHCPFDLQQDYFDRHIRLSQETGQPFIVHMRDCMEDILIMLRDARERGPLHGVMHSYTGDESNAAECVELGMHISFAGMVTFKKSDELRTVASSVPSDRILIETDAPYLSPHPKRGVRPNEPALICHIAECLAAARNVPLEEFSQQTHDNALRFFRLVAG
ncbi:TatD family hydrolase [Planctomycetota bacterium]